MSGFASSICTCNSIRDARTERDASLRCPVDGHDAVRVAVQHVGQVAPVVVDPRPATDKAAARLNARERRRKVIQATTGGRLLRALARLGIQATLEPGKSGLWDGMYLAFIDARVFVMTEDGRVLLSGWDEVPIPKRKARFREAMVALVEGLMRACADAPQAASALTMLALTYDAMRARAMLDKICRIPPRFLRSA
jgi:hypothetical protein